LPLPVFANMLLLSPSALKHRTPLFRQQSIYLEHKNAVFAMGLHSGVEPPSARMQALVLDPEAQAPKLISTDKPALSKGQIYWASPLHFLCLDFETCAIVVDKFLVCCCAVHRSCSCCLEAGSRQVLVKLHAAALNHRDEWILVGLYPALRTGPQALAHMLFFFSFGLTFLLFFFFFYFSRGGGTESILGADGCGTVVAASDEQDQHWIGKRCIVNPSFNWGSDDSVCLCSPFPPIFPFIVGSQYIVLKLCFALMGCMMLFARHPRPV
jgi:hypothetical protein